MASVNKVILVGNLGRDPEVRFMPNGDPVANVAIATSYRSKDRATGEQKETTEWHRLTFFARLAEIVRDYLKKGSSIYIEGRLQTRKYTDKDGVERYATEVIVENLQMLGSRQGGDSAGSERQVAGSAQEHQEEAPPPPLPVPASENAALSPEDYDSIPF